MTDPASLNVSVSFTGLSSNEFRQLLEHMSDGATLFSTATKSPIGGFRYEVTVADLSIVGAVKLTTGLRAYLDDLADKPLADWERELLEEQARQSKTSGES